MKTHRLFLKHTPLLALFISLTALSGGASAAPLRLPTTGRLLRWTDVPNAPLDGLWQQPCTNGNMRTEFFQQQSVSLNEIFFSDKDCRQASVVFINDGTFVLPAAGWMDFKFTSVRLRLVSQAAVTNFNDRKVCGFADWQLGTEKEISGRSCEIFVIGLPQRIPTAGDMRYGIYKIDQDHLYLGKLSKEHNASTPAARPIDFDPRSYVKVPHRPAQFRQR